MAKRIGSIFMAIGVFIAANIGLANYERVETASAAGYEQQTVYDTTMIMPTLIKKDGTAITWSNEYNVSWNTETGNIAITTISLQQRSGSDPYGTSWSGYEPKKGTTVNIARRTTTATKIVNNPSEGYSLPNYVNAYAPQTTAWVQEATFIGTYEVYTYLSGSYNGQVSLYAVAEWQTTSSMGQTYKKLIEYEIARITFAQITTGAESYNAAYPTGTVFNFKYASENGSTFGSAQRENEAYQNGYEAGQTDGKQVGYAQGYAAGHTDGVQNANKYTFTGLLNAVIYAPMKALTGLLNFEILGVNMLSVFTGLLTVALILGVVKLLL